MGKLGFLVVLWVGCVRAPSASVSTQSVTTPSAGLVFLEVQDPMSDGRMKLAVFYPPALPAQGTTRVGPYELSARTGLEVAPGRHPLIVLSHGHTGSNLGHHDLAEQLALAGYLVAAVEHPGDNWKDASGIGTDRVLFGRAYQVSRAIDAVLADGTLGAHVDGQRIGVAGFSAGGYTALTVLGAVPDFTRIHGYCARHPGDSEFCAFRERETVLPAPPPLADPRVKAAFVMAPLGIFFAPEALLAVRAPVFLAFADQDRVLLPDENAKAVACSLPKLVGTDVVTGAGHYVLLAPCSMTRANVAPELCRDPAGVDRVAVHARLAREARTFFDEVLRR